MSLKQKYQQQIIPELEKQLGLDNVMSVPKLEKVVINMGMGEALKDRSQMDKAIADIRAITGQQPRITQARKSVASFKLREGQQIGLKVTLRKDRMYDFIEKLFALVLPRLRDFQGVPLKSFDGQGNYTLGLSEQIIFPEIDYGKIDRVRGLEITFVTNTAEDQHALALLTSLGMPFQKSNN